MNIEKLNKESLEYILYEKDLSIVDLFRVYTCMKKYDFDEFDYQTVIDYIDDSLAVLEYTDYNDLYKQLNAIKRECFKYRCDVSILNKYIDYVKEEKRIFKKGTISKIIFYALLSSLGSSTNTKKSSNDLMQWEREEILNGNYSSFNFEEQELEDDDFYFDDLD